MKLIDSNLNFKVLNLFIITFMLVLLITELIRSLHLKKILVFDLYYFYVSSNNSANTFYRADLDFYYQTNYLFGYETVDHLLIQALLSY